MLYIEEIYKLSKMELMLLVKELIINCDTAPAVNYIKAEAPHDYDYNELLMALINSDVLK